jgi:RNA polymerase sigma factor (sigma-70 family)
VQTPDTDLVARVLADDDRHAFAELLRRHQSALRGFLRRLTEGDAALADDLAQEACIEAYRSLAKFSGSSAFSTWLMGIGYNRFRQWRRKRREIPMAEVTENADESADTRERGSGMDVKEAMRRLCAEERTALELCYGQGLSHEEAANVLGCPLGTVKSHILRAKEHLRNFLAAYAANA